MYSANIITEFNISETYVQKKEVVQMRTSRMSVQCIDDFKVKFGADLRLKVIYYSIFNF